MQLDGEYTFNGPREEVWDLLQDPDVLKAAMPGAKSLDKIGDDQYEAQLQVRVGPVNGVFATKISLTDKTPPERYTLLVVVGFRFVRASPGWVARLTQSLVISHWSLVEYKNQQRRGYATRRRIYLQRPA